MRLAYHFQGETIKGQGYRRAGATPHVVFSKSRGYVAYVLNFAEDTYGVRPSSSSSQIPAESSAHDASVPGELWAQRDQPALECVK